MRENQSGSGCKKSKKHVLGKKKEECKSLYQCWERQMTLFKKLRDKARNDPEFREKLDAWDYETKIRKMPQESAASKRAREGPPNKGANKRQNTGSSSSVSGEELNCFELLKMMGLTNQCGLDDATGGGPLATPLSTTDSSSGERSDVSSISGSSSVAEIDGVGLSSVQVTQL